MYIANISVQCTINFLEKFGKKVINFQCCIIIIVCHCIDVPLVLSVTSCVWTWSRMAPSLAVFLAVPPTPRADLTGAWILCRRVERVMTDQRSERTVSVTKYTDST